MPRSGYWRRAASGSGCSTRRWSPSARLPEEDALALLVDRARLVDPAFVLAPGEGAAAGRLCALVDRLPFGLELVARHLRLLGVSEVAQRVESDLSRWAGEAAGGRRGLWVAVGTSVARLRPQDRMVLVALAVMVADADIEPRSRRHRDAHQRGGGLRLCGPAR